MTQEEIEAQEFKDEKTYRRRVAGALAIIAPRNHPKAKYANWDVGWEREAALRRNDPQYRRMVIGEARAMGVKL